MSSSSVQLQHIVLKALALPLPEQDDYLVTCLKGEPDALAAARQLLATQSTQTLIGTPEPRQSTPHKPDSRGSPRQLGSYRILDTLGEGGMGVVYLAEQDRPRRTVALKVIRPGLLTPRVLRRFEVETQTLARLQHPNIAQVFDAGSLDDDRSGMAQPYFAMEHVRGLPLNDYASAQKLESHAKIELFLKVCDAVQHAHLRGVIHRDLKSSNILVTTEGEPKILDFGVAKLSDAEGGSAVTLRTDAGQIVGTVPYMSPEQIAGQPDDVDSRSDVYTLGVVLFELLTGRLPHPVIGRTLVEASIIIAQQSAPRLGSVNTDFRGDLEVIVEKAMVKEREGRYQSPADFAADLRRFLSNEPILARPSSTVYHLRKFARRNRPVVAAAAAAMVVLVAGVMGVSWQAVEATRGRNLAERMRLAADEAKAKAIQETEIAKQINALLNDALQAADPDVSLGREMSVVEALDRTAANLDSAVRDPRVLAAVRSTLSATYQNLGKLQPAEVQASKALELCRALFGEKHPETIAAMRQLANVYADMGRFGEADPLAREALATSKDLYGNGSGEIVGPLVDLFRVLHESGRHAESKEVLDQALTLGREMLGERHIQTMFAMHNMASALKDEGRFDESIRLFRHVIELRREVLGLSHTQTLSSMNNLAATLQRADRNQDALDLLTEVYDLRKSMLGEDHAATITSLSNMSVCLVSMGRLDEAEPLVRKALDGYTRVAGEQHTKTLTTMANLAFVEEERKHDDEAERLYRRVIELRLLAGNPNDPELLTVMNNLAMLLHRRGDFEQAAGVFANLVSRCKTSLGESNYICAIFANNYGDCLVDLRRLDEARPLLESSLATLKVTLGEKHARVVKAELRLRRCESALSLKSTTLDSTQSTPR